jgi:hypothetical protein
MPIKRKTNKQQEEFILKSFIENLSPNALRYCKGLADSYTVETKLKKTFAYIKAELKDFEKVFKQMKSKK